MTLSVDELLTIENLACLESAPEQRSLLADEINSILDFVQQLQTIGTENTAPLFHPMELRQRLRADEPDERNCAAELAELTRYFDEGFYLAPKVIDSEK
ncbi:Asp-tRNA(Asn)/Glu-tRNA(Gln) amidotransferase subunit GatC [Legionella dresdenensis]|uniref:Glutamyl-tRNA(Gln) amidotransferase subunit C n=1 Tax=Legionella dresdenensis TaxID=450200 RepID=A0ABV8CBY1_9GAMM